MIELKISKNEAGQRLNKFLLKYLNSAPSSFLYKMLRKKNIVLNEKKAKGDEILSVGDSVKLYLSDDTIAKFRENVSIASRQDINTRHQINSISVSTEKQLNTNKNSDKNSDNVASLLQDLKILYKTEDVLAVHKPVGVLSQKATQKDYSINEAILEYCIKNNIVTENTLQTFKPSVCNRLDRNTSGIILAGISLRGSQQLSSMLKNRDGEKYYFTIVNGDFKKRVHDICYINKNEKENLSNVISSQAYQKINDKKQKALYDKIETEFIPINYANGFSLLKIKLITGKSHQIRAHLKHLGYPIIGDLKYGDELTNRKMRDKYKLKNQLLHAGLIIFPDGTKVFDDLPEQFMNICKGLGLDRSKIR